MFPPFPQAPDLTVYAAEKAAGRMVVAKVNGAYVLSTKRFDPSTGAEVAPLVQTLDKDQVAAQITALQGQVASLNELVTDLTALG